MSTVCEFPNTLAITSWLVIKAIKVVHTARAQCYTTVVNTGKLKLKSNLASVRHGEIYGNLIGSHVYWWQWPWHYLVAYFHIPSKHDQRIIFTAHLKQAQQKSIRFVNSSAQAPYFLKLTADVTTSGWLGKVCWGLPFFLKLKIMSTLFTKPLETVQTTIFRSCNSCCQNRKAMIIYEWMDLPISLVPFFIWSKGPDHLDPCRVHNPGRVLGPSFPF